MLAVIYINIGLLLTVTKTVDGLFGVSTLMTLNDLEPSKQAILVIC